MKNLTQETIIKKLKIANRLVAGPMGCTAKADENGIIKQDAVRHFAEVARGGPGLIIQGATSITDINKAHADQAGIWSDDHIRGLSEIASAVHETDTKIILQLEHAGYRALVDEPAGPSDFVVSGWKGSEKKCRAMTETDIEEVKQLYINAARRAYEAGYDGIELHAGHGWLLSTFLNPCINKREDKYGQDLTLLIKEIFDDIRRAVPEDFVTGIRMGVFNPDMETGILQGRAFEQMGFDFLDVSNNPVTKWLPQYMDAPEGYEFTPHEYSAGMLKKSVNIPVMGGKQLRTAGEIDRVFELENLDMVTLGRPFLADERFAEKVINKEDPVLCRHCKGRCPWALIGQNCAAWAGKNK